MFSILFIHQVWIFTLQIFNWCSWLASKRFTFHMILAIFCFLVSKNLLDIICDQSKGKKKPYFIGCHETNKNVSWYFNVHFQDQYHYCNVLSKINFKIISMIKFKRKTQNLLWLHFNSITLWVVLCIWRLKPMLCGSSLLKEPLTLVLTLVYSKVIWEWDLIFPILKTFWHFLQIQEHGSISHMQYKFFNAKDCITTNFYNKLKYGQNSTTNFKLILNCEVQPTCQLF